MNGSPVGAARGVCNRNKLEDGDAALTIQDQFGQIDIYVFDQILRGNIDKSMRVLDAGYGGVECSPRRSAENHDRAGLSLHDDLGA
jgi:hypothetical protein